VSVRLLSLFIMNALHGLVWMHVEGWVVGVEVATLVDVTRRAGTGAFWRRPE
jgi:hypothetical protein